MEAVEVTQESWEKGFVIPGFPVPPINTFLGGRLISHDPAKGVIRFAFPTSPEYANPAGNVFGGMTAAFLDHIPGPLAVAATGGEAFPVSLDIHVTYFKPVPIGPDAIAEARIDRMTKSVIFTTACILGKDDEIMVRSIQSAMLRPTR